MGVETGLAGISRAVQGGFHDILLGAQRGFDQIVGNVGAVFSPMWDGGFAGISRDGLTALNEHLEHYCQEIEGIIDGFNENADVEQALKGAVQAAAKSFIQATKELLKAYVSHIREEIKESNQAYDNYERAAGNIAGSIQNQADELRQKANETRVDTSSVSPAGGGGGAAA